MACVCCLSLEELGIKFILLLFDECRVLKRNDVRHHVVWNQNGLGIRRSGFGCKCTSDQED